MRMVLYIGILAALVFAPVQRLDVAKLLPVRAVAVYEEENIVVLETDSGYKGSGEDALQALESLKETTPYVVYLDTADYLLVAPGMEQQSEKLHSVLKRTVQTHLWDARGQVDAVANYLDVHGKITNLRHPWTK